MTSPPWFRFYSETLSDRKVARICRVTQLPKMTIIGAWATLMALANDSPIRGVLLLTKDKPFTLDEIADEWGADLDTTGLLLEQFTDFDMIHTDEDGTYYLSNWDKRQFSSDSSTERVRKYRKKQRTKAATETPKTPNGNASETLQERYSNGPEQNRAETDTEQNIPENTPPQAAQNENDDDEWLSESRIVNLGDESASPSEIPKDPLTHAAQVAQKQQQNWADPPDAGGYDDYADGPVDAFCALVGIAADSLPDKKRSGWGKALRAIGQEWGVGPPRVAECIRALPDSEYSWKTYSSPHQSGFQSDLGVLIGKAQAGKLPGSTPTVIEVKL